MIQAWLKMAEEIESSTADLDGVKDDSRPKPKLLVPAPTSGLFDKTPTPTRLFQDLGLFPELAGTSISPKISADSTTSNPFDEHFKAALKQQRLTPQTSLDDSLNTPQIFPLLDFPSPQKIVPNRVSRPVPIAPATKGQTKAEPLKENKRKRPSLPADDEEKRQQLLERNRAAAQRSRNKRKKVMNEVRNEHEKLRMENKALMIENAALKEEIKRLNGLLSDKPQQAPIKILTLDPRTIILQPDQIPVKQPVNQRRDILHEATLELSQHPVEPMLSPSLAQLQTDKESKSVSKKLVIGKNFGSVTRVITGSKSQ